MTDIDRIARAQGYPHRHTGPAEPVMIGGIGNGRNRRLREVWHTRFLARVPERFPSGGYRKSIRSIPALLIGWDAFKSRWSIVYHIAEVDK